MLLTIIQLIQLKLLVGKSNPEAFVHSNLQKVQSLSIFWRFI